MAKRTIVPASITITVAGGSGEATVGPFAGHLTYIRVIGPGGAPTEKGRIRIDDVDLAETDIFSEPLPADTEADLDFFQFEFNLPVNGTYKIKLTDVTKDGAYTVYYVQEDPKRRVL